MGAVEKEDGWHIGAARLLDILRLGIPNNNEMED